MRVGSDFQAYVPNVSTVQRKPAPENHNENAILIWSPDNHIPEEKRKCRSRWINNCGLIQITSIAIRFMSGHSFIPIPPMNSYEWPCD